MKRFSRCLTAAILLSLGSLCAQAELVDGIAATVGPEVILHSELVMEIAPFLRNLQQSATSDEEFNRQAQGELRKALDEAVNVKILLREALLAGLEIQEDAVEERIAEIKKRFATEAEFLKEMEKAGETMSDFRQRIRKQILAMSMAVRKRRQFEKEAQVSETEMAQYYKENEKKFAHPERASLRRIFLAAGTDPQERTQAKARLEEVRKQIDAGADFAELAKTYSTGPEAPQGGLMGWVTKDGLVPNLSDVAFSLPEGGVSSPLETEGGVVLLKVEKKEPAGTIALDEARKQIEPELRAKFAEEKYKKWIGELRKRSRVRIFLS